MLCGNVEIWTTHGKNLRRPAGKGASRHRRLAQNFGDVRTRRAKQQAAVLAFNLQFWVNHYDPVEAFDGLCSKAGAALRRVGVPGSEAPAQRLPGNQRGPRQVADPPRSPGVEIERKRRPLESPDGPQVQRHRSSDKLLKEVRRQGHRGPCQNSVRQLLRRPPKMKPVCHQEIFSTRVILPVGITRPPGRDGGTD